MMEMGNQLLKEIFKDKRVLITGHTGFQGSWLSIWLKMLGAEVIGYALDPYTQKDNYVVSGLKDRMINIIGDLRDWNVLRDTFNKYEPKFVFHLAAQSLVLESYKDPKETYDVNIGGTVNVLECCRVTDSVKVIINVTSDKCYLNNEWIWPYRENDPMGGFDPYSSSKGCSELITSAYRQSFFNPGNYDQHLKSISSVRAGNVIGGGDWHANNLIAGCIIALENNRPIQIRNPIAIRPWQHVLDALYGYLLLTCKMSVNPTKFCGAWNFGPSYDTMVTVEDIVNGVIDKWGKGTWETVNNEKSYHEANTLRIDSSKAQTLLEWKPIWGIDELLDKTIEWYKNYRSEDMYELCKMHIISYLESV